MYISSFSFKTLATVLALGLVSFGSLASAFTLNLGPQNQVTTGWASPTVIFNYDSSCAPYLTRVYAAIDTAAELWGSVRTSSLRVQRGSNVNLPQAITAYVGSGATSYAPVGNTIIYCDTSFGANSGEDANSIPGFAGGQNYASDGTLLGGLLVLNVQGGANANITTLNSTLVSVILAHEIGHCLGVGHSSDPEALMYYQTGAGRLPELAKDDIDAVTYLYPQKDGGTGFLGCATVAFIGDRFNSTTAKQFLKTVGPDLLLLMIAILLIRFMGRVPQRRTA